MTDVNAGTVDVHVDGPITTLTLNRPAKLNALTPEMLDAFERALVLVDADPDVRVVVVASAGTRVFCAGADINRFRLLDGTGMWFSWTRRGHQVFDRLAALRQPTIAAIDGNAFGGGLELALACDLRVAADSATLGLTEVGLGTVPGWGGTQRLTALIGASRAKEMVLTGDPIDAATAHAWGLVHKSVATDEVAETAHTWARQIALRAPVAVQMAKQAVDVAAGASPGTALEGIAAAATASHHDFQEGVDAFTQRRTPVFTGLTRPDTETAGKARS
jgi:enoyl-CoA hydratase/carnithine racemase